MTNVVGIDLSLRSPAFIAINSKYEIIDLIAVTDSKMLSEKLDNILYLDKNLKAAKVIDFYQELIIDNFIKEGYTNFCIEGQSYGNSFGEWIDLYGVTRHTLRKHNCNYIFPPPNTLKKFILGKSEKDKYNLALKIYKDYNVDFSEYENISNNIIDAFCLCVLGLDFYRKRTKTTDKKTSRQEIIYKLKTDSKALRYINESKTKR